MHTPGICYSHRRFVPALLVIITLCLLYGFASQHPCELTSGYRKAITSGIDKWFDSGGYVRVSVNCSARYLCRVPGRIEHNVTKFDLSSNRIVFVRSNDFDTMIHLRILILSDNSIRIVEPGSFQRLRNLERLDLNNNDITSFTSDVFVGLSSLRMLSLRILPLTTYPTEFAASTRDLRVLSLSAIGNSTIPAEYAFLPRLAVLDFFKDTVELTKITAAMFNNIRDSNISTLAYRSIQHLQYIDRGAFSNLPNLNSLIIACNRKLSFRATVASMGATSNTSVETVVLDGAFEDMPNGFIESDFCSPFWRYVQRLSVKCCRLFAIAFNHTGCLSNVRQLSFEYNSLSIVTPSVVDYSRIFPNMHTLVLSHKTLRFNDFDDIYCYEQNFLFDADDYFPGRPPVRPRPRVTYADEPCGKFNLSFLVPPSVEFLYLDDIRVETPRKTTGVLCYGNMRFLNYSHNKFTKQLCTECHVVGVNRVEIIDLSHGALETVTAEFFRNFTSLRFLNLSHNSLGVSNGDFRGTFAYIRRIEELDLSHNKLKRLNANAFKSCKRLRQLILAGNYFHDIDINLRFLEKLNYLDLSENHLLPLRNKFMDSLDRQYRHRHFEVNIQRNVFTCTSRSVPFIRWTRATHVRLTGKDQLTCSYGERDAVLLTQISLEQLEAGSDSNIISIVLPVIAGVIFVFIIIILTRSHRWYIKYHVILCWETTTKNRIDSTQHDAIVLYFMHSANARDQREGVARISRWVFRQLLTHAESEWGLSLYVGDRDDVVGASKMYNFVRSFRCSDKVVVCLTQEFIDDNDCMNYLTTALNSSRSLTKYIFVLFDEVQPASVQQRLRQLLLPDAPTTSLTWGTIDEDDDSEHHRFWRNLRDVLTRDPDQTRCRRHFDVLAFLETIHETTVSEIERNEDLANTTQL